MDCHLSIGPTKQDNLLLTLKKTNMYLPLICLDYVKTSKASSPGGSKDVRRGGGGVRYVQPTVLCGWSRKVLENVFFFSPLLNLSFLIHERKIIIPIYRASVRI